MAPMRRGLVHAMAWTLATGAAVTLSWWGVHTVVVGTAYDRPRALPITGDGATTQRARPQSSSTHRPPSPPPSPSSPESPASAGTPEPSRTPDGEPPATAPAEPSAKKPPPDPGTDATTPGNVKSYPVDGGRVVFDLGGESAELVSATPEAGWRMQVWKQDFWIRVTFTRDDREVSVFCTWHDSAPRVQIDER
ncbi:hypothetical protein OG705_11720 [Streptomyces sp. NBC_00838]|uniref:hypothetical protein n=1 Tax=Streptomyces sp. NBC_00838 TaxID=2903680 RepID=UPI00386BB6D4|nr:hypothetical protein OG705_11720 [Streptomyces sp. NBC_00838]